MLSKFVIRVYSCEREKICNFLAEHYERSFFTLEQRMTDISDILIENGEYGGWSFGHEKSYFYPAHVVSVDEGIEYLLKKKSQILEEENPIISSQNTNKSMYHYHCAVTQKTEIKGKEVIKELIPHSVRFAKNSDSLRIQLYRELDKDIDIDTVEVLVEAVF